MAFSIGFGCFRGLEGLVGKDAGHTSTSANSSHISPEMTRCTANTITSASSSPITPETTTIIRRVEEMFGGMGGGFFFLVFGQAL